MSRVLDVNDCPLHNFVHDIVSYPKYYDPIYYPHCHPKIFQTPMTVKEWIKGTLNCHFSECCGCCYESLDSIKYSVVWHNPYFLVCSFLNGIMMQCTVSLKDPESPNYTHCWLLSQLCDMSKTFTACCAYISRSANHWCF